VVAFQSKLIISRNSPTGLFVVGIRTGDDFQPLYMDIASGKIEASGTPLAYTTQLKAKAAFNWIKQQIQSNERKHDN
jgi:hypothetical protein